MIIIKFGGSVITDKSESYKFRQHVTSRLAGELRLYQKRAIANGSEPEQLILVHGAGSFGHILANKYELDKGFKTPDQLIKVAEVKKDVRELNLEVLKIFIENNLNPISISPSSIIMSNDKLIETIEMQTFKHHMDMQFTPVTFGDIVIDKKLGFSICSGDQIILHLAKSYRPTKVIFVTNVDGLFPASPDKEVENHELPGELIEEIDITSKPDLELIQNIETDMNVADVTGGILGKVRVSMEIAEFGVDSYIINGCIDDRLRDCLLGHEVVATWIHK